MTPPTLFDSVPSVRNTDPDTSRKAAVANPVGRSKLRWQILILLNEPICHRHGATDFELAEVLGLLHMRGSVSKRRGDLVRLGLVAPLPSDSTSRILCTRKTDTGSPAIVWGLTPAGTALAEKGMP